MQMKISVLHTLMTYTVTLTDARVVSFGDGKGILGNRQQECRVIYSAGI